MRFKTALGPGPMDPFFDGTRLGPEPVETVPLMAVGPLLQDVLQYFIEREASGDLKTEAEAKALLDEARDARYHLQRILSLVIRRVRRSKAHPTYEAIPKVIAAAGGGGSAAALLAYALKQPILQEALEANKVPGPLVKSIERILADSKLSVKLEAGRLVISDGGRALRLVEHSGGADGMEVALDALVKVREVPGAILPSLIMMPEDSKYVQKDILWSEALPRATLFLLSALNKDIRTIEQLGTLPSVEGSQVWLVVAAVGIGVGIALEFIAGCWTDLDPEAALVLKVIGQILDLSWLGNVLAWTPVEVCRTDPATGVRDCARFP